MNAVRSLEVLKKPMDRRDNNRKHAVYFINENVRPIAVAQLLPILRKGVSNVSVHSAYFPDLNPCSYGYL